jgi:tryptophanyl-tRNA synthetase
MSKSVGNTILLSDQPDAIQQKMRGAVTDVQKVRKNDPGRPEVCLVFTYHQKYNPGETAEIETGCRSGALGCVDCKKRACAKITDALTPFREKRAYFDAHPGEVVEILNDGESRARARAAETMAEVRTAMKFG